MRVKFWGTRASVPTPGPGTIRFGGNTPCLEVCTGDDTLIILDCGTGARALGRAIEARKKPVRGHIFLSHTHWDHIQGFPFFAPAFIPGNEFTIYGARGQEKRLEDVLAGQMEYQYFPVTLSQMQSRIRFQELGEGSLSLNGVKLSFMYMNHTTLTLGYRIEADGQVLVYATDNEPHTRNWRVQGGIVGRHSMVHEGDRRLVSFVEGVDLLIHDSQYTKEEYASKNGWGHSPVDFALDVAIAGGVKRLALFHHDPDHDDRFIADMEAYTQQRAADEAPGLEVFAANEGEEVLLGGPGVCLERAEEVVQKPKLLIAEDDATIRNALEVTLQSDGYQLLFASNGEEAIEKALVEQPDLILLDVGMPILDGYQVCHTLRANPTTSDTTIIMLTGRGEEADALRGFQEGVNDYITKPFAVAQLRTRVKAWLLRRGKKV